MLKDNIARKIKEQGAGFKCSHLSRKTNIHPDTLLQILKGNTKNPNIQTITKIAQALNSSIDDLVGLAPKDAPHAIEIHNPKLLLEIVSIVVKKTKDHPSSSYSTNFLNAIIDIYYHSARQNKMDIKFAEWCIETYLLNGHWFFSLLLFQEIVR